MPPAPRPCKTCGSIVTPKSSRAAPLSLEEAFWSKVEKTEGCWQWTGATSRGYGRLSYQSETISAHRFSYRLHGGTLTKGMFVCHRCDNPLCMNPDHLFLGTSRDTSTCRGAAHWQNASPEKRRTGARHHASKLSPKKVREMRSLYANGETVKGIAKQYGVDARTTYAVLRGETWKHVLEKEDKR